MEFLALAFVAAFLAAALTVPAGFGLSTMLTPVVLLMMGPHEAVAVWSQWCMGRTMQESSWL